MGMMKGMQAIQESTKSSFMTLKMKSGESKVVRILTKPDEIISLYEHVEQFNGQWYTIPCLGKDVCPLCQADKRASFKAYLFVVDRADDKVKLFKAGKKVAVQLLGLVEEYGDINGRDFKVFRQGDGLDTTYQFFARDAKAEDMSSYEVPEIETVVKERTREEILELMEGTVADSNAEAPAGKTDFPF